MKTVVYTQPDCRACERVIGKLRESGIDPEVIDVSRDLVAKDYLTRFLRASSVPVIEAPGFDAVIGYQPDKVKEIIDALGV
jgi:glutaredoxin-like protein NrdH